MANSEYNASVRQPDASLEPLLFQHQNDLKSNLQEVGANGLHEVLPLQLEQRRRRADGLELFAQVTQRLTMHPRRPVRLATPTQDRRHLVDVELLTDDLFAAC